MQGEAGKLRKQSNQFKHSLNTGAARVKKDLNELKSKFGNIEEKKLEHSKSTDEMNLRIQHQENKTTYDETFWNIYYATLFCIGTG